MPGRIWPANTKKVPMPMHGGGGGLSKGKAASQRSLPRRPSLFSLNNLMVAHARNGHLEDARRIFDTMPRQNAVSWNVMIAAYARNGCLTDAQALFERMPERTLVSWNTMISSYSASGRMVEAREAFDAMPRRDVVSWNAMIAGYAKNGPVAAKEALSLLHRMSLDGSVKENKVTFIAGLDACSSLADLSCGKVIHSGIVQISCESDVVVGNTLLAMYGKCNRPWDAKAVFDRLPERTVISWTAMLAAYAHSGLLEDAERTFDAMPQHDLVSWNAMIAGYARNSCGTRALDLFQTMNRQGVCPNTITFIAALDACSTLADHVQGKIIHACIASSSLASSSLDITVSNALINMYGKCGRMEDSRRMFDRMSERDVMSWNSLISAFYRNGHVDNAWDVFNQMPKRDSVSWTSMIAANARDGHPENASVLFQAMPERRDIFSWNAMIAAHSQNGQAKAALEVFNRMALEGSKPDGITFISILDVCANSAALKHGKLIHSSAVGNGCELSDIVASALVNMYGKCGSVEDARNVFERMGRQNVAAWTALIAAYAQNGHGKGALELLVQMRQRYVKPNGITFMSLLSACSHAGLLEEARSCFFSMYQDDGLVPGVEHYVCMVGLLGRAGQLSEAEGFVKSMPFEAHAVGWMCLLGACRTNSNEVELASHAANHLFALDPDGFKQLDHNT